MKGKILFGLLSAGLVALAWSLPSLGGMSSPSFEIPSQVLDSGGAESASAGYLHIGALGQTTPIGFSQSTTFRNRAGYIAQLAVLVGEECWDDDGDGYEDEACGGDDCDDADSTVNPGADEICDDLIDNDCDGLADLDDPDCLVEFTLDLEASYVSGLLSLSYTIGTPETATWRNYLVLIDPAIQVVPLWSISLPIIEPPIDIPVSFPLPSLGWVGIWSGLFTAEGPQAVELAWVDTG